NGQDLTIPVFTVTSDIEGPEVYIQANIHGAEIQGNAVIYQLLKQFESLSVRGKVTLVPQANPLGINQKSGEYTMGRFDPITGDNWNRLYHCDLDFIPDFVESNLTASDEEVRGLFREQLRQQLSKAMGDQLGLKTGQHVCYALQKMALEADYVLDLHTGPASSKHLYVAEYAMETAAFFNIPHVLVIPNGFDGALDEACFVPWWSLTEAFARKGRQLPVMVQAFTVELGSQEHIDLIEAQADANSLLSYLSHKELFTQECFEPAKMTRFGCHLKDYKTVYSPCGGLAEFQAVHGEILPAGQPLAQILQIQHYPHQEALQTLSLPEPVIPVLNCASGSVYQGTELYKVFYRFFEIE
ncbi:MAG: putative deacylase, partial [Alteromonadaceae bacterium]